MRFCGAVSPPARCAVVSLWQETEAGSTRGGKAFPILGDDMRAGLGCAFLALTIACSGVAVRPALAEPGDAEVCENGTDSAIVIAACTPIIEARGTRRL